MATIKITPTPPSLEKGRFVTIPVDFTGSNSIKIFGGWWEKYPQNWELSGLILKLTCTADVANRSILVFIRQSEVSTSYYWYVRSANITASQSRNFEVGPSAYFYGSAIPGNDQAVGVHYSPQFSGDEVLHLEVNAVEAGDNLRGFVRLKYINPELGIPNPYGDIWRPTP